MSQIRNKVPGLDAGASVDLLGSVERVRVVNSDEGWGHGSLYVNGGKTKQLRGVLVPFHGNVADLYEGATVRVQGSWESHERFGWQVRGRLIALEVPDDGHGARAWIAHRFEDVGPVIANRLVAAFPPPELWRVLVEEPEKVAEVEGVGPVRAEAIMRGYQAWQHEREQFETLAGFGLRPEHIRKAVDRWGREAAARIGENPYALRELSGIGWKFADQTARKMGIRSADPRRVHAGLLYAAECREREGHTCGSSKALRAEAAGTDVLRVSIKVVGDAWPSAIEARVLVPITLAAENTLPDRWFRPDALAAEETIANGISDLLGEKHLRGEELSDDDDEIDGWDIDDAPEPWGDMTDA